MLSTDLLTKGHSLFLKFLNGNFRVNICYLSVSLELIQANKSHSLDIQEAGVGFNKI